MKAFPILFFTLMQWALNAAEVPKFKRIQLTDKFYKHIVHENLL